MMMRTGDWGIHSAAEHNQLRRKREAAQFIGTPDSLSGMLGAVLNGILVGPAAKRTFGTDLYDSADRGMPLGLPLDMTDTLHRADRFFVLGADPAYRGLLTVAFGSTDKGSEVVVTPMVRDPGVPDGDEIRYGDACPLNPNEGALIFSTSGNDPAELRAMAGRVGKAVIRAVSEVELLHEAELAATTSTMRP